METEKQRKFCVRPIFSLIQDLELFVKQFLGAALQRCFYKKLFWKYIASLQ